MQAHYHASFPTNNHMHFPFLAMEVFSLESFATYGMQIWSMIILYVTKPEKKSLVYTWPAFDLLLRLQM